MYYDSYYKAKPTKIGNAMNVKLNQIISRKISMLFDSARDIKVLEIGYGRGLLAEAIKKECKHKVSYYAIEPNHLLAEDGRKKGDCIIEKMIPPFPLEAEWDNFDIVIFSHVIEHFHHYSTILQVLGDAHKRLKSDGFIVVFFPDYLDYKEDFFSVDHSHEYILTLRRMRKLFIDSHFKIVEKSIFRACFQFPQSTLIYIFHLLIKFIANVLWNLTNHDLFFKLKITFARNILLIGKKET